MNPLPTRRGLQRRKPTSSIVNFRPVGTIRCSDNIPRFRSQLARDLGCLLDFDDDVTAWCCQPAGMDRALGDIDWKGDRPDFFVTYESGTQLYIHVTETVGDPEVTEAAACYGLHHRFIEAMDIRAGPRLQNAKDLLQYARARTPLGDRIRIVAALEQEGSVSVADCLGLFREIGPMAGLASLILHRFVSIDLDSELISPNTAVLFFRK